MTDMNDVPLTVWVQDLKDGLHATNEALAAHIAVSDMTVQPAWATEMILRQERMQDALEQIMNQWVVVSNMVEPLIEQVSSHPLVKMFLGGHK